MIFSTQTEFLGRKYGMERAVDILIESGYPAIDISMFDTDAHPFLDDSLKLAEKLRQKGDSLGVKFIQAHAPFGGGYDNYLGKLVPLFPRAFEFCSVLGIENIVVHPLQSGRYYGNEEKLFDMNMKFYSALAPLAKTHGVKIAIENMWQRHPITGVICDDVCAPPEELVRYYDTLNDPETFTICLDIGHVALCGREPEDAIRIIGRDRLGCLHVHDNDYRADSHILPGTGSIAWDKVCKALAEIGYNGSFNLEADYFYRNFAESMYPTVTKFMADISRGYAEYIDSLR